MFDLNLSAPALDPRPALDPKIFAATLKRVRAWLESRPDVQALVMHTDALELALAAQVKNPDAKSFALVQEAVTRVNQTDSQNSALDALTNAIILNLQLFQFTRNTQYKTAAQQWAALAVSRFDETLGLFRADALDAPNVFWVDANARLANAFYLAWRVLDEQSLRPIAGEILGQVSAAFAAGEGLYQRVELPDGARSDTKHIPAYAEAMQMFLTAMETTGRGTYVSRAQIVADFLLKSGLTDTHSLSFHKRALLADALTRLFQFTHTDAYRGAADALLRDTSDVPSSIDAAQFALAVEHATNFPLHLVIIGEVGNDENAQALWKVALQTFASAHAIEALDPQRHAARIQALGYTSDAHSAVAYVCRGAVCLPPVYSAEQLRAVVQWSDGERE